MKEKRPAEDEEEDDEPNNIEEMPTIADVQDERPQDVKVLEEFKKSGRWKTFLGKILVFCVIKGRVSLV